MTTIVMNTLNGAVTEYDWTFQSITPEHAGTAVGLYALGGDFDADEPIAAEVTTGSKQWTGDSLKNLMAGVYLSISGEGSGELAVYTRQNTYAYPFDISATGVCRVKVGRGVRESYLAFSLRNVAGAGFRLDGMQTPSTTSKNRRL